MAKSIDLFVDAKVPLVIFAREIEGLLGVKLQRVLEAGETWYEFRDDHIALTVGEHDFENDRDMNFRDYRYHLSIRALNIATEEERKTWREGFARFAFEKLKSTGKYGLLLVEDIQKRLDEFRPEPAQRL
ncbi:MAG: hypothetical protein NZT92_06110 [Abditibacteriales bacterium]|nr:hypothetical protein [Abditibacteriales bacterium]MDW8366685.1 hypothetical protein [Abditibacteriales bacterium]